MKSVSTEITWRVWRLDVRVLSVAIIHLGLSSDTNERSLSFVAAERLIESESASTSSINGESVAGGCEGV